LSTPEKFSMTRARIFNSKLLYHNLAAYCTATTAAKLIAVSRRRTRRTEWLTATSATNVILHRVVAVTTASQLPV
jgi:hypothetical protein